MNSVPRILDTLILSAMGLSIKKTKKDCIDVSFRYEGRLISLDSIQSYEFSKTCIEHIIRSFLFDIKDVSFLEGASLTIKFSKVGASWRLDLLDGSYVVHSSVGSTSEFMGDLGNLVRFFSLSPSALILQIG